MSGSPEMSRVDNVRKMNEPGLKSIQDAKKVVNPYYQDTLSSMQPELAKQDAVTNLDTKSKSPQNKSQWIAFYDWIKGLFTKKEIALPSSSQSSSTSTIEQVAKKNLNLYTEEMEEMNRRLRKMNEEYEDYLNKGDVNAAEAVLIRLLALMVKAQVKNKEIKTTLNYDQLQRYQKTVDETLEAKNEHGKENDSLRKQKKVLDVSTIVIGILSAIGLAASAVGAIAVSVLSGGTLAIPSGLSVALAASKAVVAIAAGGNTLLKGWTEHSLSKNEKETYLLDTQRELAKEGISLTVKEIDQAYNEIANYWSVLKEIAEKHRSAIHSLSRN